MTKAFSILIAGFLMVFAASQAQNIQSTNLLNNRTLVFEENRGQIADTEGNIVPDVKFRAKGQNMQIFFFEDGISYQFEVFEEKESNDLISEATGRSEFDPLEKFKQQEYKVSTHRIDMRWSGINKNVRIYGQDKNKHYSNYYHAHCPEGLTKVSNFKELVYEDLYPGIDVVFYSNGEGIKYDYYVSVGADPREIKWTYDGVEDIELSEEGHIELESSMGFLRESRPLVQYQNHNCYEAYKNETYFGFDLDNNTKDAFVIDPQVIWGTYFGGGASDYAQASSNLDSDSDGNIYVAARTTSTGIALNGFQNSFAGSEDGLIVKFNSDGSLSWASYYGGTLTDYFHAIHVSPNNDIYTGGVTHSLSGISSNGFQNTHGGGHDAMLIKFDTAGQRIWGTYYGGTVNDHIFDITSSWSGDIWFCGWTDSPNNIEFGGQQSTFSGGQGDAFICRFDSLGQRIFASYLGGTANDIGFSIEYAEQNEIYLAGITESTSNISYPPSFQSSNSGTSDAFIVKFNDSCHVEWGTYLGGPSTEGIYELISDQNNNIYFVGYSFSTSGISFNGYQNSNGGHSDAFFGSFNSNGLLNWSSYYGGSDSDFGESIIINNMNEIVISGNTYSSNNIASNHAFQKFYAGNNDAFVASFDLSGYSRNWGTYFGGSTLDQRTSICSDIYNRIWLFGTTQSNNINFQNGYDLSHNGGTDLFLTNDILPCHSAGNSVLLDEGGVETPPYGLTFTTSGTGCGGPSGNGAGPPIACPTGRNFHISDVLLADTTTVYYGCDPDTFSLSYRGYNTPMEFMKFRPDLSDLCQGMARWRGETRFSTLPGTPIYTRFTMTVTRPGGAIVALNFADSVGLAHDVGGVFEIEKDSTYDVNLKFEVTTDTNGSWQASIPYFDSQTGQGAAGLHLSSYAGNYFWVNSKPNVDINTGMTVVEGATDTVENTELAFSDLESSIDSTYLYLAPGGTSHLPKFGTLKLNGNNVNPNTQIIQTDINLGRISYEHSGTEEATDTLFFSVVDAKGAYEKVNGDSIIPFVFYIQPINDDPILVHNNGITVDEGDTVVIDSAAVYFTDVDSNTDSLSYTLLMGLAGLPNHGDLQLNGVNLTPSSTFVQDEVLNGNLRYIHDGTQNYLDTFQFYLQDDSSAYANVNGDSVFSFIITINPVNDPPILAINTPLVINEGANALILSNKLLVTDEESPNDSIYYEYAPNTVGTVQFGQVRLNGVPMTPYQIFTQQDIDSSRVRYFHNGDEYPLDNFVFMVTDAAGDTASDNGFTMFNYGIAIIPVNDLPIGLDTTFIVPGGTILYDSLSVYDPDDSVFIYSQSSGPFNGTLNSLNPSSGAFEYEPNSSFAGLDSMIYTVQDQQGAIDSAVIRFDVIDLPPVAIQDSIYTDENITVSDTLEATDPNQQTLSYAIASPPQKGNVNITNINTGEYDYIPNNGSFGLDHFTFTADDGTNTSIPDTVLVHIRPDIGPGDLVISVRRGIVVLDPVTLEVGLYSSYGLITNSQGLAFEPSGDLLAIDATNGLLRIDDATGSQSILTPDTFFTPGNPGQIDLDVSPGGNIYISDGGGGRVYEIDPISGDTNTIAHGGSLTFPTGIKVAGDGNLIVADAGFFASDTSHVLRIDPNTGNQNIISSGDSLAISIGLAEDYNGDIIVSDAKSVLGGQDQIYRIDTIAGQQILINSDPQLDFTSSLDIQRQNGEIYLVSSSNHSIYRLDRSNNSLTLLAQGGLINEPFGITVVQKPNTPPSLVNAIPDTSVEESNNLVFPIDPGTFSDPDPVDTLNYTAQLAGGGSLPSWLNFDANTITFSGTPAISDTGLVSIEVIASDHLNQSAQDDFNIQVYTILGLGDNRAIASILMYPVPAKDIINISSSQFSGDYFIELRDIKGRVLRKIENSNKNVLSETINVSGLSSGSYFINIYNDDYQFKRKIVIE